MKVGFLSLGCPKNLVDSEVMIGLASQAGHELTTDPADAEVLVVNTCAFIDAAKQESVDAVLEMARHKQNGSCQRLIVTGCLAERYRDDLRREVPEIDAVLGTGEVPDIVRAIQGAPSPVHPLTFYRDLRAPAPAPARFDGTLPTYIYDADTPRVLTTPRHFAYVKVAEGCDYACSFCIIPTLRGHYRSRPHDSIIREAHQLAAQGVRELILISQDTTFYGNDRGERGALGRLLRALGRVDGLEWIRLLYLYPTTITDDTLAAIAETEKVCRYIDLPLQHAAPDVLRRMKRPGTRRTYEKLLARIRDWLPDVTLRSTFIVGFPGETEDDFAELCGFVSQVNIDHLGVFTYSHEDGTTAFDLPDDVPAVIKRRRRKELMTLQKRRLRPFNRRRIGHRVRVMVDGPAADHPWVLQARLPGQAPDIDSVVYLSECEADQYRPGDLIRAVITGARGYDLVARPAPQPEPIVV